MEIEKEQTRIHIIGGEYQSIATCPSALISHAAQKTTHTSLSAVIWQQFVAILKRLLPQFMSQVNYLSAIDVEMQIRFGQNDELFEAKNQMHNIVFSPIPESTINKIRMHKCRTRANLKVRPLYSFHHHHHHHSDHFISFHAPNIAANRRPNPKQHTLQQEAHPNNFLIE